MMRASLLLFVAALLGCGAPPPPAPARPGRLPPAEIQRVIRQDWGRFRDCYKYGLRKSPALQGQVAVKFVIAENGSVSSVSDGGSDMPDREVVKCVVHSFSSLRFPAPESGKVHVTYPIVFSPGEEAPDGTPDQ